MARHTLEFRGRLRYSGGELDRVSALRTDPHWVKAQIDQTNTRVVPVWRAHNLLGSVNSLGGLDSALMPAISTLLKHLTVHHEFVLLGTRDDVALFAVDVSDLDADELGASFDGEFADLRLAGTSLPASDASILAYARGLLHWHRTHRHCGGCGELTGSLHGGHMRRCPNCRRECFPRIDPAVIMLVEAANELGEAVCLLGRHARLPAGIYSTLAGFVEPGESLEQTVIREVFEEAGVHVDRVVYRDSQPWPFPSSLMLGFRATARSLLISPDDAELEDVRWFNAAQVRAFSEWSDASSRYRLPRDDSIARVLVEEWLSEQI